MGPIDFIVIGIVLLVVALAAWYVIRAKKNGAKCIGCPSDCNCSKSKKDQKGADTPCACCCGCGGHGASSESAERSAEAPSAEDQKN